LEDTPRDGACQVRLKTIVCRSASLDKLALTAQRVSVVLGDAVGVQDHQRIGRKRNYIVRRMVLWKDA
jgi:hypothetical protein